MTIDFLTRKRMVLSELKLCMFGIVAFVECCNVIIFLPSMSCSVFPSCSPNELVLFLLLLCKFPFEWSQTFGSDGSVASR